VLRKPKMEGLVMLTGTRENLHARVPVNLLGARIVGAQIWPLMTKQPLLSTTPGPEARAHEGYHDWQFIIVCFVLVSIYPNLYRPCRCENGLQ
jgi:hypothetical protein